MQRLCRGWTTCAVGGVWATMLCMSSHAQVGFIPQDQEPRSARAGGGCFAVGHRVLGVPWGTLSWSRWMAAEGAKPIEWAKGLTFEGGSRWSRVHGFWGGMREWDDGNCMFQVSAGLTSWPTIQLRRPWLEGRLSATREAPWGNLRMEARWTIEQRRSTAESNDAVARAESPWAWTAWWTPKVDGAGLGLPALGWSRDGQWALAWNAQGRWAEALRFWRPPPGNIHLQWRLPAHVFEIAWKGSLASSTKPQNPKTFTRGKAGTGPRHAMGCAMRRGQSLPGWRAFWMWERTGNAPKAP